MQLFSTSREQHFMYLFDVISSRERKIRKKKKVIAVRVGKTVAWKKVLYYFSRERIAAGAGVKESLQR